ncbi:hypothetical protein B0J11DRAFT_615346 [Dendryphion nanum]|uniref:Uncharacterized protein n=1 Tax=Dendryphion nanum TaxID=256645 RepID=A0A9P9DR05_9PLEO|nr:hypothetical protein B0J11DRAFT_615346 [Dendryphion nanum]
MLNARISSINRGTNPLRCHPPSLPIASPDAPIEPQLEQAVLPRRSSSVSPSQSPSDPFPLIREQTRSPQTRKFSSVKSNRSKDRGKSFSFNKISWRKRSEGFEKTPDSPSWGGETGKEGHSALDPESIKNSPADNVETDVDPPEGLPVRRVSRLRKISGHFKSFFTVSRRRRDSPIEDSNPQLTPTGKVDTTTDFNNYQTPGILSNPHAVNQLQYERSFVGMDPLAYEGALRFAIRSTECIEPAPGPSDYWRDEKFKSRKCSYAGNSPYSNRTRQDLHDQWHHNKNASKVRSAIEERENSSITATPRPLRILPTLSINTSPEPQKEAKRIPFVGRLRTTRQRKPSPQPLNPSHAPSTNTTHNELHPFGPNPDLNLSISIHDLGVLPGSSTTSFNSSTEIPHPIYAMRTSTSRSDLLHNTKEPVAASESNSSSPSDTGNLPPFPGRNNRHTLSTSGLRESTTRSREKLNEFGNHLLLPLPHIDDNSRPTSAASHNTRYTHTDDEMSNTDLRLRRTTGIVEHSAENVNGNGEESRDGRVEGRSRRGYFRLDLETRGRRRVRGWV